MLLALVAQWLALAASTAHHAQAVASGLPWAQVCRSAGSVALPGDPASDPSGAPAGASPCPVCAAAALVAPPPTTTAAWQASAPAVAAAPHIDVAVVVARALPPPARAPPSA